MADDPIEPKNDARFTLWLPGDLLEEVKIKAVRERRPTNAVIVEAIKQALKLDDSRRA